jgi:hypothetical protein
MKGSEHLLTTLKKQQIALISRKPEEEGGLAQE